MEIFQSRWDSDQGWIPAFENASFQADFILVFGERKAVSKPGFFENLRKDFPTATILTGSTAGEIVGEEVSEDGAVLTAVKFEHTKVRGASVSISDGLSRREAGERLGQELLTDDLALVFVVSDGQNVNGSSLVEGLDHVFKGNVPVTGGLAGDGYNFSETAVGLDTTPMSGKVAALGFYGSRLKVGYGTVGGWDPFGPIRLVTKSEGNVLYELDGKSALTLYKDYLGDRANELPASALLFPLTLLDPDGGEPLVRTVLAVNEDADAMIFAGDIPEGSTVRLMQANLDRIVDGAVESASRSLSRVTEFPPELAILVSCVGRKLILGQRIDEEVEEVRHILGDRPGIVGFYSYGEISPGLEESGCSLHNQTMTITTLAEE